MNEALQGEIVAEAQMLEQQFIEAHQALVTLKSSPCASAEDWPLRRLLVSYLEATEDRVVVALDTLILRARGDADGPETRCGTRLHVANKDIDG